MNLYGQATATIDLGQELELRVRQETDYPTSGRVVIHIDPSATARFWVRLRVPAWCQRLQVAVNDESVRDSGTDDQTAIEIERQWTKGDAITLDMPCPGDS